jgi:hypothetical protein
VRLAQVDDVAGLVVDLLDLQGVHDQAQLAHLVGGRAADLAGEPLAVEDEVLDGEVADDRSKVAGEELVDRAVHGVLLVQEAPGRVGDAGEVVAHLVDHHAPHVDGDALLGHAGHLQVRRAAVEPEPARGLEPG